MQTGAFFDQLGARKKKAERVKPVRPFFFFWHTAHWWLTLSARARGWKGRDLRRLGSHQNARKMHFFLSGAAAHLKKSASESQRVGVGRGRSKPPLT